MSTRAQLEAQGYTLPTIDGDVYRSVNGTITSGSAKTEISLGGIAEANSVEIINDNTAGSGDDLYVILNENDNDSIRINAGESKTISNFLITSVYFTNQSGSTITYRLNAFGVSNT